MAMNQQGNNKTVTLYRPIGPGQLQAVIDSGWRNFPPRLATQKYFYPLIHESFARRIAGQWHVERSGVGYVMAFQVNKDYLDHLPVYIIGGPEHKEYRIRAGELDRFNNNIVGKIKVIAQYEQSPLDSVAV